MPAVFDDLTLALDPDTTAVKTGRFVEGQRWVVIGWVTHLLYGYSGGQIKLMTVLDAVWGTHATS